MEWDVPDLDLSLPLILGVLAGTAVIGGAIGAAAGFLWRRRRGLVAGAVIGALALPLAAGFGVFWGGVVIVLAALALLGSFFAG